VIPAVFIPIPTSVSTRRSQFLKMACCICIRTNTVGVVEECGQFKKLTDPGFHCILYPIQMVAGTLSLRIQQLDVMCETKTKDNVFVKVGVAVQYRVITESAYQAYYRLADPCSQIQSYVFDVVRSTIPKMKLDEAFASKADIAQATLTSLEKVMREYGYEILNTLVTDLDPDAGNKTAMNEITASKRIKEAASHKAEANKVKQIKAAEADAESRYLSGVGVARQRKAIVEGLKASVSAFSDEVEGATPKDVMDILLLTQYFDTLAVIGANNLILEHDPSTVANLQKQVSVSFLKNQK